MNTPYLDAIKTAAAGPVNPNWWSRFMGLFRRGGEAAVKAAPTYGRGRLLATGALALGGGLGAGALYAGSQQNKWKQQGYNDAMTEVGPLVAARHLPQGAMTLRAHQRPMG